MKEDFLHHLWLYKKINTTQLFTAEGQSLTILNFGQYTKNSGPDFFNAQIVLNNQKWAGNIEIHVKSSDWYLHQHEQDQNYDNVILHVVWEHDTPIFGKDNREIPVLEIKKYVDDEEIARYHQLTSQKSWLFCENQIAIVDDFVFTHWLERVFIERLDRKSKDIEKLLEETNNDWEAVLFCLLAKNFGLNTNGVVFFEMAKSIPFGVIRKEAFEYKYLEALFFGQANMLPSKAEDTYVLDLIAWCDYLRIKYGIKKPVLPQVQFFKHRPDNFPTIRLAQLAMLYHVQRNLFAKILTVQKNHEWYDLFSVSVGSYWKTHYTFDKPISRKQRLLSKSFVDLILMNTIIPLLFTYYKSQGIENFDSLLEILRNIAPEKNNIIDKFGSFGVKSKNAFQTQALLQLKNEYCNKKLCLECAVGLELLKK
ncbi:DUF2851 family protein [Flavobacterium aciduliphilum]|nr:DUF2851 family protein [Flavobacterium aciduliphilum]